MKHGRLTILEMLSPSKHRACRCECDCGNIVIKRYNHVVSGATRSCGCLASEMTVARNFIHGSARRGKVTPEFTAWSQMRGRCLNPANEAFEYYGGRGIAVCQEWTESFERFLAYMGPRPTARHSLDRVKVDGNYEPGNCRWATKERQSRNKTNTTLSDDLADKIRQMAKSGVSRAETARILGLNYSSVKQVALGKQWVPESDSLVAMSEMSA